MNPEDAVAPSALKWRAGFAAGLVVLALGAALAVAGLAGAVQAPLLADPGPVLRWGLLVNQVLFDLSVAVTIGALVLAAIALPVPAVGAALRLATITSAVWALSALAHLLGTYVLISGSAFADPEFGPGVAQYAFAINTGGGLYLASVVIGALLSLGCAAGAGVTAAGWLAVLALAGLVPLGLGGHASGTASHETAVTAFGLHLLGVSLWVGGLISILAVASRLSTPELTVAVRRFSPLAGIAVALVAGFGLVSAVLRVGSWASLWGGYGALLGLKATGLLALVAAGAWMRRRGLAELAAGQRRGFARLAAAEAALMALIMGLSATLARSEPPVPEIPPALPSQAESLTGYPMPPKPGWDTLLTVWQPDLWWIVVAGTGLTVYALGVRKLHHRGDSWGWGRTISWTAGWLVMLYLTCGAPAAYGRVLFSGHMVGHMTVSMLVGPLLVLGAPITLALRALPHRSDGTRGAREWLLAVLGSRYAQVITFGPVAAVIFVGSLIVFYYSPLFELALRTHLGHEAMHTHFLLAGFLFAWVIIGVDHGPRRLAFPLRLVTLFSTMVFHAFFGVALMSSAQVLGGGYFAALDRPYFTDLLADQRMGGSLAWGIGDIPTLLLAVILAVQWARADDRESKRRDRAADRDGDAELAAYNQMLQGLAEHGRGPLS